MRKPATKSRPAPASGTVTVKAGLRFRTWLLAVLLALVTMARFWPALRNDFVNYDDETYVTANIHVQNGLTLRSIKWAFLNPVADNWHPLTVVSHMLDCQLFGLQPWGHHLTSVLLHALNAALAFTLLQQMTGARWRSLFVAALFAVHPLRVESVAWVAERKDVLSGCFGLLALMFYGLYVQKKESKVQSRSAFRAQRSEAHSSKFELRGSTVPLPSSILHPPSSPWYYSALIFFALGLVSKPMLVTWPFVMLLLDYWPLQRFTRQKQKAETDQRLLASSPAIRGSTVSPSATAPSPRYSTTPLLHLFLEKIPFLLLSAVVCVVTFLVQQRGGAMTAVEDLPLGVRGGNALISYCRYLGEMFWPTELAVFYPLLGHWPLEKVLLAAGLLLGISVVLWVKRRPYPFLLMGWLWFCGTLVPVIGLVQVGTQAMADRYTYIPSLGVLILAVWGAYELTRGWHCGVITLSVAGSTAILLCFALTRQQIRYWKDSEALLRHALAVTKSNWLAHNNLGATLMDKGQIDEAISQLQAAIRLKPDYADAHNNLGIVLGRKGQIDEAISQLQAAVRLKPDDANTHYNLGLAFDTKGQINEAISQYQEAIRLKPDFDRAQDYLARALKMKNAPASR